MSSFHQPLALYAGNTFITANSSLPEIYIFYSTWKIVDVNIYIRLYIKYAIINKILGGR